jgi:perosamine synthetase
MPFSALDFFIMSNFSVPHNRLTFDESEERAVLEVIKSGYWSSGPKVKQLEKALREISGTKYAVCVSSGLSALRLSLLALGIKNKDKIVVPAYCCVALINAVLSCGAIPIPVDVLRDEWTINPAPVLRLSEEDRVKAVIAIHLFGLPARIKEMENNITVIEDCAHAFGMRIKGMALGNQGKISILSFFSTKLIGGGEGGAVLTNDESMAEFIRNWRDYTDKEPSATRLNDKMTDIEASIVLCQLMRLEQTIALRREKADLYHELLHSAEERYGLFTLPDHRSYRIWYRYPVVLKGASLTKMIGLMKKKRVDTAAPVEDWRLIKNEEHGNSNYAYKYLISLPLYPTLTKDEQVYVAKSFLETCRLVS